MLKVKTNKKTDVEIRSLKHTKEKFVENLCNIQFPDNKSTFDSACSDFFIDKLDNGLDEIAPIEQICIQNNTGGWFNEVIYQGIKSRDKLFNKVKISRPHTDNKKGRNARNRLRLQELNKKAFFYCQ